MSAHQGPLAWTAACAIAIASYGSAPRATHGSSLTTCARSSENMSCETLAKLVVKANEKACQRFAIGESLNRALGSVQILPRSTTTATNLRVWFLLGFRSIIALFCHSRAEVCLHRHQRSWHTVLTRVSQCIHISSRDHYTRETK